MTQYRKKPVVIEATQWFKNGDHPKDYLNPTQGLENGVLHEFSGDHARINDWSGQVVGRYRTPAFDGQTECRYCVDIMHNHGWIDTLEGGHIVCPGDFIITGVKGEVYPCKPDIFAETYAPNEEQV